MRLADAPSRHWTAAANASRTPAAGRSWQGRLQARTLAAMRHALRATRVVGLCLALMLLARGGEGAADSTRRVLAPARPLFSLPSQVRVPDLYGMGGPAAIEKARSMGLT